MVTQFNGFQNPCSKCSRNFSFYHFDGNKNFAFRCFKSGDVRVNEHIGIATIHQLFVREHNRIAEVLKGINAHWTDEQVFQETRSIVGAEIQHITYKEFLPSILGQVSLQIIKFLLICLFLSTYQQLLRYKS